MARICVAGVGAVGATVAARLAAAGETVTLLARGARFTQLGADGLRVAFDGEEVALRLAATDRPDAGIQDIVITATKAQGLPALLPTLAPLIGPNTVVMPLVNGIPWWYFQGAGGSGDGEVVAADPAGLLRDAVAAERIVGCVVYLTARLLPSGQVAVMGGQRIVMGELGNGVSERATELAGLFARAGIGATASARIRDDLWTKVALNLATNPLSVITRSTLREHFTDAQLLPIVSAILEEVNRVAEGYGARRSMSLEAMLETGRQAGAFETSMLQDYRAGRMLELDAIAHGVFELARKIGVALPTTELIVALCTHLAEKTHRSASQPETAPC